MPKYAVEFQFMVPVTVHHEIEAVDDAAAIAIANQMVADDDIDWGSSETIYDASTEVEVSGLWESDVGCYSGRAVPIAGGGDRLAAALLQ